MAAVLEFDREIRDICRLFTEITKVPCDIEKESAVIRHWLARGWKTYDFRLVIEHLAASEREKEFFSANPGLNNLRGYLNPNGDREGRLVDIHAGLKAAAERKSAQQSQPLRPAPMMLMRCGVKIPVGAKDEYRNHMDQCFKSRGACFF